MESRLTLEQRKYRVNRLFRIGYHSFKDGMPQPANRIEAMGWRLARKEQVDYQAWLEQAVETFAELDRWDDLGYLD
jgi:hypothetical protein